MQAEIVSGQTFYKMAHDFLRQPYCNPWELRHLYPHRRFEYGEDGYGLVLEPRNVVYISSESAEGIRVYENPVVLRRGVDGYQWMDWDKSSPRINGFDRLPEDIAPTVVTFAQSVWMGVQDLREQIKFNYFVDDYKYLIANQLALGDQIGAKNLLLDFVEAQK